MPDENFDILTKTPAGTAGGTQATASLHPRSEAAKRLQAIFDSTKGEPGSGELPAEAINTARDLGRAFGEVAGAMREGANAANKAQMGLMQAQKAAAEAAEGRATRPEAVAREVAARGLEGEQIPGDQRRAEEAKGKLPAGQFAAPEARIEAPKEQAGTGEKEKGRSSDFSHLPPSLCLSPLSPGAAGGLERATATAEAGERAGARNEGERALSQPKRDAPPAGDQMDPAMKALLVEVAKVQARHLDGLRQAVDVITGTSETVDRLVGLMRTMAAHQQQLQSDQSAIAQQLAAWARTTQIP